MEDMRNLDYDCPILYIGLGVHESDSKRFFSVGTTTLAAIECREHVKHMRVLWIISLSGVKTKRGWDKWDTDHMGPHLDRYFERTPVKYDATYMKTRPCHTSRTNSWWSASKSVTQQLDSIIEIVTEKLEQVK